MERQKRVKIHEDWFGLMVQEGDQQSLVRVTKSDEPLLVGKTITFMNHEIEIIEEERQEMSTVQELTNQYNAIATTKGLPPVKKFKDKVTAERRLAALNDQGTVEKKSGTQTEDDIVNKFRFKNGANQRKELLLKLIAKMDQLISKKELGDLASCISGLRWSIESRGLGDEFEIKEEKKDGQTYFGLFRR